MRLPDIRVWVPVAVLGAGCALLLLAKRQEAMPLTASLQAAVPAVMLDEPSFDRVIPAEEQQVAGMDDYLLRTYGADSVRYRFSVYVGYYEEQVQGRSIHSPKNCLPGAGWEPVSSETRQVKVGDASFTVNRYLLANQGARAIVYYWYQGRGRVAWNEFAVKWELFRDKALHGRSEEALVRIVIPVLAEGDEGKADQLAVDVASRLIPSVFTALPVHTDGASPLPAIAAAVQQ